MGPSGPAPAPLGTAPVWDQQAAVPMGNCVEQVASTRPASSPRASAEAMLSALSGTICPVTWTTTPLALLVEQSTTATAASRPQATERTKAMILRTYHRRGERGAPY